MNESTIWYERIYKRSESNLLPPTVRFDRIDGSYDDSNKPKPKNPQKRLYFDRLSERHAIREGSNESAKIADSGEKDYSVQTIDYFTWTNLWTPQTQPAISNSGVRPDRCSREKDNESNP